MQQYNYELSPALRRAAEKTDCVLGGVCDGAAGVAAASRWQIEVLVIQMFFRGTDNLTGRVQVQWEDWQLSNHSLLLPTTTTNDDDDENNTLNLNI